MRSRFCSVQSPRLVRIGALKRGDERLGDIVAESKDRRTFYLNPEEIESVSPVNFDRPHNESQAPWPEAEAYRFARVRMVSGDLFEVDFAGLKIHGLQSFT